MTTPPTDSLPDTIIEDKGHRAVESLEVDSEETPDVDPSDEQAADTATGPAPDDAPDGAPDGAPDAAAEQSAEEIPCADAPLATRIEALLLATERPVTEARLAALLGIPPRGASKAVRAAIDELNATYEESARSFRAHKLAGGWQLMTTPDFGPLLSRMLTERQQARLSQAALETLAIVAYLGRAEELGRPMLYGTTREFLHVFGLPGLDDLPKVVGLEPGRPKPETGKPKATSKDAPTHQDQDRDQDQDQDQDQDRAGNEAAREPDAAAAEEEVPGAARPDADPSIEDTEPPIESGESTEAKAASDDETRAS
ncbi:MAG: SMC-Scp complex subunit ScpB [Planctomycetota bacterium]|jgi:segregation and condensation protein B